MLQQPMGCSPKALDPILLSLLCLPTYLGLRNGLEFWAPKKPKTSISRLINGPYESLLPSIPQPT
ncbi:hypothetical protein ACE6H2_014695 [Prunus campanulata]